MLLHKQTVKNSGMAAIGSGGETMKIFTAILTQTDTDPPAVTVLVNTLGEALSAVSYNAPGVYSLEFNGNPFGANEVVSFTNGTNIGSGVVYAQRNSTSVIRIASTNGFASFEDNIIRDASLIILIP